MVGYYKKIKSKVKMIGENMQKKIYLFITFLLLSPMIILADDTTVLAKNAKLEQHWEEANTGKYQISVKDRKSGLPVMLIKKGKKTIKINNIASSSFYTYGKYVVYQRDTSKKFVRPELCRINITNKKVKMLTKMRYKNIMDEFTNKQLFLVDSHSLKIINVQKGTVKELLNTPRISNRGYSYYQNGEDKVFKVEGNHVYYIKQDKNKFSLVKVNIQTDEIKELKFPFDEYEASDVCNMIIEDNYIYFRLDSYNVKEIHTSGVFSRDYITSKIFKVDKNRLDRLEEVKSQAKLMNIIDKKIFYCTLGSGCFGNVFKVYDLATKEDIELIAEKNIPMPLSGARIYKENGKIRLLVDSVFDTSLPDVIEYYLNRNNKFVISKYWQNSGTILDKKLVTKFKDVKKYYISTKITKVKKNAFKDFNKNATIYIKTKYYKNVKRLIIKSGINKKIKIKKYNK